VHRVVAAVVSASIGVRRVIRERARTLMQLGRWLAPEDRAAWLDILRNATFALALVAPCISIRVRGAPPTSMSTASDHRRSAFSLVEVLVVVVVIATLIALLLPALAQVRWNAQRAESLAGSRRIVAILTQYSTDNREHFPAFVNRGPDGGGPVEINGQLITTSFLGAHMRLWPAAIAAGDRAELLALNHPRFVDTPIGDADSTIQQSSYFLTPAVAADHSVFQPLPPSPIPASLLRANRWSDVAFPANKGLLLDAYWWSKRPSTALTGFADGSADAIKIEPTVPLARLNVSGPFAPVICTIDGLRGRDR
jgi:type II secretory pathway pseudopilin PulG